MAGPVNRLLLLTNILFVMDYVNNFLFVKNSLPEAKMHELVRQLETRGSLIHSNTSDTSLASLECDNVNSSTKLTDVFMDAELGWSEPPPHWVQDMCPEVIEHFERFPMLRDFPRVKQLQIPAGTTEYFSKAVCALKALDKVFRDLGGDMFLAGGSHLGAIHNGQPIPWDDDIDVLASADYYKPVMTACEDGIAIHPNATLRCHKHFKLTKVWVDYGGMKEEYLGKNRPYKAPFIDLVWFREQNDTIIEVPPDEARKNSGVVRKNARIDYIEHHKREFFPGRPYYFAGTWFKGPNEASARRRYPNWKCMPGYYNHHIEKDQSRHLKQFFNSTTPFMDCCRLTERFPFRNEKGVIRKGNTTFIPKLPSTDEVAAVKKSR